jgi:pimeloyl-ACP methyl ester carboxylesterase
MQLAQLGDITLEYELGGNPKGPPVLLISSILADGSLPFFGEAALTERYRLIRYHKRGWVGSTRTPGPVGVDDHVDDAARLLERLGIAKAHVVGHSSGATVALQLAVDRPALVASLGLLEPTILSVPAADGFFAAAKPALDAFSAGRPADAVATFLSLASGLDWQTCSALLETRMPGSTAQTIKDADTLFGVELPGLMAWSFGAEVAEVIRAPALSVRGEHTQRLWIEVDERLRATLPRVDACVIDRVGHLLQVQNPAPVARALADFFADHPLR